MSLLRRLVPTRYRQRFDAARAVLRGDAVVYRCSITGGITIPRPCGSRFHISESVLSGASPGTHSKIGPLTDRDAADIDRLIKRKARP